MACDVTSGRSLPCKDSRTGIKSVDFAPFSEYGFSVAAQEIATLPVGLTTVFRYLVKATGNKFDDVPTINLETRTVEYKQTLSMILQKVGATTEVQLMLLLYGRVIAFVKDYNGNVFVVGIDSGMDATTAPRSTDTSGYTVTLEATDGRYAPYLSSAAKTALEALVSLTTIAP
ncbi:MAG: hypothetical protein WAW57_15170 [Lutibacter sp.]